MSSRPLTSPPRADPGRRISDVQRRVKHLDGIHRLDNRSGGEFAFGCVTRGLPCRNTRRPARSRGDSERPHNLLTSFCPLFDQIEAGRHDRNRKFSSQVKGDLDTHLRHEECKQRSETQTLPSADTQPYCSGVPASGKRYQPRSVDRARRFELLEYAFDRKAAFA